MKEATPPDCGGLCEPEEGRKTARAGQQKGHPASGGSMYVDPVNKSPRKKQRGGWMVSMPPAEFQMETDILEQGQAEGTGKKARKASKKKRKREKQGQSPDRHQEEDADAGARVSQPEPPAIVEAAKKKSPFFLPGEDSQAGKHLKSFKKVKLLNQVSHQANDKGTPEGVEAAALVPETLLATQPSPSQKHIVLAAREAEDRQHKGNLSKLSGCQPLTEPSDKPAKRLNKKTGKEEGSSSSMAAEASLQQDLAAPSSQRSKKKKRKKVKHSTPVQDDGPKQNSRQPGGAEPGSAALDRTGDWNPNGCRAVASSEGGVSPSISSVAGEAGESPRPPQGNNPSPSCHTTGEEKGAPETQPPSTTKTRQPNTAPAVSSEAKQGLPRQGTMKQKPPKKQSKELDKDQAMLPDKDATHKSEQPDQPRGPALFPVLWVLSRTIFSSKLNFWHTFCEQMQREMCFSEKHLLPVDDSTSLSSN